MSQNKNRNSTQKRKVKKQIFGSRNYVHCCFCKRELDFNSATLEHVIPLSIGGNWDLKNIQLSCSDCNNERGNSDFYQYRDWRRGLSPKPKMHREKVQTLDDLLNSLSIQYQRDRLSALS